MSQLIDDFIAYLSLDMPYDETEDFEQAMAILGHDMIDNLLLHKSKLTPFKPFYFQYMTQTCHGIKRAPEYIEGQKEIASHPWVEYRMYSLVSQFVNFSPVIHFLVLDKGQEKVIIQPIQSKTAGRLTGCLREMMDRKDKNTYLHFCFNAAMIQGAVLEKLNTDLIREESVLNGVVGNELSALTFITTCLPYYQDYRLNNKKNNNAFKLFEEFMELNQELGLQQDVDGYVDMHTDGSYQNNCFKKKLKKFSTLQVLHDKKFKPEADEAVMLQLIDLGLGFVKFSPTLKMPTLEI